MTPAPTVLLYELNEVPWSIVDLFVERHPDSAFAHLLATSRSWTTINHDSAHLSPWRTWPTMHRSLHTDDHNSWELGQDPSTFQGTDLWDPLDEAGHRIGLFGPLQSWPAKEFKSGGFHVPDTFASDAVTNPAELGNFQAFNLRMTSENSFSSDAALSPTVVVRAGFDMLRLGLRPRSGLALARHLAREVRDPRWKAARPMMQVLPSFDLFRRLQRRHDPALGVFFTNHVASMMHRFWGDAVPGYAEAYSYDVDSVYREFVLDAMRITDDHLRELMRDVDTSPGARLVVAASMGQGPIEHGAGTGTMLHLDDPGKLATALDCGPAESRLAMYPMCSLEFDSEDRARRAAARLSSIRDARGAAMFADVADRGRTVTFWIASWMSTTDDDGSTVTGDGIAGTYGSLGLATRERIGGENTAYHVPDGILLDYGAGGDGDRRTEVDALDFAPSMLENMFAVQSPPSMRGHPVAGLLERNP